jgi:predicted phage baseplate assembly protein
VFITQADNEGRTTVVFGNGARGARLPTGQENVTAVYRTGIGAGGNVKADQITLLAARPSGVKEVTNPLRASGGAGPEGCDEARAHAPLAVMTLDRLVSTVDYEDFSRTFAGIGKASAARLSDGRRQVVHVTIAGVDDIPIDKTSDLYRSLVAALRAYGDAALPIQVELRELLALVISANVQVDPDYLWEKVEAAVRTRLLETFGVARRALGQPVFLSEVIAAIQSVPGVVYVDVDLLDSVSETELSTPQLLADKLQTLATTAAPASFVNARLARIAPPGAGAFGVIQAAQLAILLPAVPETLTLNEVPR